MACLLAGPVDDRAAFLLDADHLGRAELIEADVLELEAQVLADELPAREDGDVAQHGLAAIAEARGLDRTDVQDAAQPIDDQGGQGFAFDVLGDDEQRPGGLGHLFQQRQHVADVGQLLFVDEDERVFHLALHLGRVGDEVGRNVALVELHALDELEGGLGGLAFLDGDDAVLADLLEGVGHLLADDRIVVGADGGDLLHLLFLGELLGHASRAMLDGRFHGLVDAALDDHRVGRRRR